MPVNDTQLSQMFEEVLTLSKVDATQSVAVLKSGYSDPRTVRAATDAALRLGAKVYGVELPAFNDPRAIGNDLTAIVGQTPLSGHKAALEALMAADLIVDTMMLLHSPEQERILKSGTRMLLAVEPPEMLARMLPTLDDKRRVEAAAEVFRKASTFHAASKAGTDFHARLGQYPVVTEYGFADEPGRWDHWPSGFLFSWPDETSAEGVIVLDVGDILLPFKRYAQSQVVLEISAGYIRRISGGFDADFLRSYMEHFNDPEVFALSHIGWGLQPRAEWSAMGLHDKNDAIAMDARAFQGNFLFSTGPNTEVGGPRNTPCHMDIPLRHCTIRLDDTTVVEAGRVVAPEASIG